MKRLYVDNGSTSFPKAPGVSDAIKDFLDNIGCNIGRGGYEASYDTAGEVLATRKLLCDLFNFDNPRNVIFTPGITYSLNMILQGFLKQGDHVITTSMEHNGMMRPLHQLTSNGVAFDIAWCNAHGFLDPQKVEMLIKPNTKAVVMTHASNVCGTILPIDDIGEICKNHGIKLIVDAAQTAGVLNIHMTNIDALAFTAHKGLLATQGLGGFIIKDNFAKQLNPIITGGTGSFSHEIDQPSFLPDKFEAGTLNIPAIIGLKNSLEYINSIGIKAIYEKEMLLAKRFLEGVQEIPGVEIVGKKDLTNRIAVISLNFQNKDNGQISAKLDEDFGIMTRCGLHCSPISHKTLGTYPEGSVRFSFGHFNTLAEVDYILQALIKIVSINQILTYDKDRR